MMNNEVNEVESELIVEETEKSERGASMVEYALLVALIAVIAIVAVRSVGSQVSTNFSRITSELAKQTS
jgi:pilus assembly protein Flp/PilA